MFRQVIDPRDDETEPAPLDNLKINSAWTTMIYLAARGDVLRFNDILTQNAHSVISFLEFERNQANTKLVNFVHEKRN